MAIELLTTGWWADDSLEDGVVRVELGRWDRIEIVVSPDTWDCAQDCPGSLERLHQFAHQRGVGLYALSMNLFTGEAEDLRRQLEYVEPGVSDTCVMPGCRQDVASTQRGFSLCAGHDADMASWDDLLAG